MWHNITESFFCAVWMIIEHPLYEFRRHLPSCLQTSTSPATHITRSVEGYISLVGRNTTNQEGLCFCEKMCVVFAIIGSYLDWSSYFFRTPNLLMNTDQGTHKASSL